MKQRTSCRKLRERLTPYLLGDLPPEADAAVRAHLAECEGCRAHAKELASTLDVLRDALAAPAAAAALEPARRARVLAGTTPRRATIPSPWLHIAQAAALVVILLGLAGGLLLPSLSASRGSATLALRMQADQEAKWAADEWADKQKGDGAGFMNGNAPADPDADGQHRGFFDKDVARFTRGRRFDAPASTLEAGVPGQRGGGGAGGEDGSRSAAPHGTPTSGPGLGSDDYNDDRATGSAPATEALTYGLFAGRSPPKADGEKVIDKLRQGVSGRYRSGHEEAARRPVPDAAPADVAYTATTPAPPSLPPPARELPPPPARLAGAAPKPVVIDGPQPVVIEPPPPSARPPEPTPAETTMPDVSGVLAGTEVYYRATDRAKAPGTTDHSPGTGRAEGATLTIPPGNTLPAKGARLSTGVTDGRLPPHGGRASEEDERFKKELNRELESAKALGDLAKVEEKRRLTGLGIEAQVSETERRLRGVERADKEALEEIVAETEVDRKSIAAKPKSDRDNGSRAASGEVLTAPVFAPAGFNPFVDTRANAFSTFSIDVDTASYALARRYLVEGARPPPESVRTEEFVNFFDYAYTPPVKGAFAVHTAWADAPFRPGLQLLQIGVKGRVIGRDQQRRTVLTLVIDTSGSMNTPDRLGLLRDALRLLLGALDPQDLVAVVQFDSEARLLLGHTPVAEREAILAAIDGMACSGSTHLEQGLRLAYEVAASAFRSGWANRVLLLSDGVANLGSASAQTILRGVAAYRDQGIYCSVFGFGTGSYNDVMLEQLADQGDGAYAFIDSIEEARRLLVDELAATLHVIASDVKIQVEFDTSRVARYRQLGYENRALTREQFRDDTVDAGEVGSGQSVTALYEVELRPGARTDRPLGTVRVRYRDVANGRIVEVERRVGDADRQIGRAGLPESFRLAAGVAEFAELMRLSPYTAGTDFKEVADYLRPLALGRPLDQRLQELVRLVQAASRLPPP